MWPPQRRASGQATRTPKIASLRLGDLRVRCRQSTSVFSAVSSIDRAAPATNSSTVDQLQGVCASTKPNAAINTIAKVSSAISTVLKPNRRNKGLVADFVSRLPRKYGNSPGARFGRCASKTQLK